MEPIKIDYARAEPKPKASPVELVGHLLAFVICLLLGLFLGLAALVALTFHNDSDPVDPAKAACFLIPVALIDLLFFVQAFRSLRKLQRRS